VTLHVRPITDAEGNRLLRLTRTTDSVVTMRRAQAVLHSAQGFSPPRIAAMLFMSPAWVRHILRRFDEDGFESLYARYRGGGTVKFDDEARVQLVHLALSRPRDLGLPYNAWSLAKLREEAARRGIVAAISPERLRQILHEEAVTFQAAKTWKESTDPDREAKKRRIERLTRQRRNPPTVLAIDILGPVELRPYPGRGWFRAGHPRRRRATYTRPHGTRNFFVCYNVHRKTFFGRMRVRKRGKECLGFHKEIRRHYPPDRKVYVIQDNADALWVPAIRAFAKAANTVLVPTATNASWMNPEECHNGDIKKLALAGSDWRSWRESDAALRGAIKHKNRHRGMLPRKVRRPLWRRH